jgi:hypothetical protein
MFALRREPRWRGPVGRQDLGPWRPTPTARVQILHFAAVDAAASAIDVIRIGPVGVDVVSFAVDAVDAVDVRHCGALHPVTRSITGGEFADHVHRACELAPGWCRGNESRRRGTEGFDAGRDVGERVEHPDEASDFLLGPVLGASEHFAQVLGREVGAEHQEAGEVEFAGGDGVE